MDWSNDQIVSAAAELHAHEFNIVFADPAAAFASDTPRNLWRQKAVEWLNASHDRLPAEIAEQEAMYGLEAIR
jgi:hypothetical protein